VKLIGLGDSVGFGVGDAGRNWIGPAVIGRLRRDSATPLAINLSAPGARTSDLVRTQLPAALAFRPEAAVIFVGGNDVLRSDFCAFAVRRHVTESLNQLQQIDCQTVVFGLPDPLRTAPAPRIIRAALSRRTRQLNIALAQACASSATHFIGLWDDENVYQPYFWHVDRMHPSKAGYDYLAEQAAAVLRLSVDVPAPNRAPSVKASARWLWLLKYGSLWLLNRSVDLFPRLAVLVLEELLAQRATSPTPATDVTGIGSVSSPTNSPFSMSRKPSMNHCPSCKTTLAA